jgi:hypothetical protein
MAVVMLRHPIDRALSVYSFARKDPRQPDHWKAASGDMTSYINWALDSQDGGVVIRNYQVIHLSDASFRHHHIWHASATRADLQQAYDVIRSFGVFGLVRRFADSCLWFESRFRQKFPELRMSTIHVNPSEEAQLSETETIERVRATLGAQLYKRLLEANELDIELYDKATAVFGGSLESGR